MAIYLPQAAEEQELALDELTPRENVADKAELNAEERVLDLLLPAPPQPQSNESAGYLTEPGTDSYARRREKLRQQLREGKLDERMVELDVREKAFPAFEIISNQGVEEMDINIKDMLPNIFGQRTKKRRMKVSEAIEYLIQEEEQRLVDMDQVTRIAVERVEQAGIIFLDEIAHFAFRVNENTENIGARRLHTIMERVLDVISFDAPDLKEKEVKIDAAYVQKMLSDIVKDQDLSRYIL